MVLFFVKQKTAYEMRISDWSSDVCSSDLEIPHRIPVGDLFSSGDQMSGIVANGSLVGCCDPPGGSTVNANFVFGPMPSSTTWVVGLTSPGAIVPIGIIVVSSVSPGTSTIW